MHFSSLIIVITLLGLSAFFVLAEFAIVRVRPTQLEALHGKDPRADAALEVQRDLSHHLSSVLVGITICAIAFGAIGEDLLLPGIQRLFVVLPWKWLVKPLAAILALLFMTTIHVVLTEMVPRSFAIRNAGHWALLTARPLLAWSSLVNPLTRGLGALSRGVERLLGLPAGAEGAEDVVPSEEEFRRLLTKGHDSGAIELSRKELIGNLFDFSKRTINEIAVPRARVVCFDVANTLEENLELARKAPHTRIPLVAGDLDRVIGVVHLKELLWRIQEGREVDLKELARPPFLVPEMRRIQDLLLDFQQRRQHLALVVNEHGGVDGLVTLEDVLEELVGEIQDEFDRETIQLRKTRTGAWVAQGNVTLEQLEDHLSLTLEAEGGSISLGGFLQERLGRILRVGDEVRIQGWRVRVLSMRGLAAGQFLLKPFTEEDSGDRDSVPPG